MAVISPQPHASTPKMLQRPEPWLTLGLSLLQALVPPSATSSEIPPEWVSRESGHKMGMCRHMQVPLGAVGTVDWGLLGQHAD